MDGGDGIEYFTEENSAEAVIARMADAADPRLRQVMTSLIGHLHAFVKEVEPTRQEWETAIGFLTRAGQMCNDTRQEWILLSDILGVSMLVDAINSRRPGGATENTVLGPFHVDDIPVRAMGDMISQLDGGDPLVVSGTVTDTDGRPVAGAVLDVWHSAENGFYSNQQPGIQPRDNLRGLFRTGADGRYWFRSIVPTFYPIPTDGPAGDILNGLGRQQFRPAHIHYIITADGYEDVTTHIFVNGDPYLKSDPVFGVKRSLIRDFVRHDDPAKAAELGVANPFWTVEADFLLVARQD
jgi:protocatechuate 3,4-dioxygenase beta subunit